LKKKKWSARRAGLRKKKKRPKDQPLRECQKKGELELRKKGKREEYQKLPGKKNCLPSRYG